MPTPSGHKARVRTETLEAAAATAAAAPVASTPADQVVVTPFCFPHGAEPAWVPIRPRPVAKAAKSTRKPVRKYSAMRVSWPAKDDGAGDDDDDEEEAGGGAAGAAAVAAASEAPLVYEVAVGDFALMRTGEGPGGRLFVGEVTDIYLTAAAAVEVDVRWLYRPDDAVGSPENAGAGDVELYESSHHDTHQDAPAIIGKAAVTSLEALTASREAAAAAAAGGDPDAVAMAAQLNATDPALHYYVSYFYDHKKQVFKPISFDKRVGVGGKAGGTPKADSPAARSAAAASPATTPRGDSKAGAPPSSAGGGGSKATKAGSDGKAAALPPAASPTSATAASPAPGGTPAPAALTPSGRPSRATRGPPSATAPAAAAAPTPPRKKRKVVDSDGDGNGDVAMSDGGGPATPATPASVPTPAPAVATPPPTVTAPPPRPATPPPTTTQFISYPWATCDAPDELGDESVASPPLSREPYICRIADFVRTARASATAPASSRVLFVSGTAGCGKTEAVRAALARATPPVVVADIDGKRLFNPMLAYSILLDAVVVARRGGRRAERVVMAPERARESLAALWPSCSPVVPADDPTPPAPDASRAEPVVVFVLADDLDVLSMRAPDVVRDFLTWHTTGLSTSGGATGEAARPVALAIVGVARRMDLPAASLSARPGTLKLLTNVAQLLVEPYSARDLEAHLMRQPPVKLAALTPPLSAQEAACTYGPGALAAAAAAVAAEGGNVRRAVALAGAAAAVTRWRQKSAAEAALKTAASAASAATSAVAPVSGMSVVPPEAGSTAKPPPVGAAAVVGATAGAAAGAAAGAVVAAGGPFGKEAAAVGEALPATKGTAAAAKGGSPVTAASPAGTTPVKAPPSSSAMNVDTPTVTAGVPPASAAKAPSPAAGIPAAGTPAVGTPAAGTPAAGTPAAGTPAAGTPAAGTPAAGTPAAGTPAAGTPAASSAASAAATPPSTVAAGPQTPFVVTAADMRGAIKCSAPGTVAATLAAASGSPYALSTAELVVLASAALLCRDAPWVPPPTRFGHAVTLSLSGVVSKAASVAPLAVKGGQVLGVQAVHAAAFGLAARGMLAVLPQTDNLRPLRGGLPDCDLILTVPVAVVVTGLRAGPLAKLFVSSDVGPVQ